MRRHGRYLPACSVLALASAAEAGDSVSYAHDAPGPLPASSSGTTRPGAGLASCP